MSTIVRGNGLLVGKLWWYATPWLLHTQWKIESEYTLHPEIVDMNYVQEERQDSLLEKCFDDTPGNFSNKIRKYSLFTRWLSTYREGRKI